MHRRLTYIITSFTRYLPIEPSSSVANPLLQMQQLFQSFSIASSSFYLNFFSNPKLSFQAIYLSFHLRTKCLKQAISFRKIFSSLIIDNRHSLGLFWSFFQEFNFLDSSSGILITRILMVYCPYMNPGTLGIIRVSSLEEIKVIEFVCQKLCLFKSKLQECIIALQVKGLQLGLQQLPIQYESQFTFSCFYKRQRNTESKHSRKTMQKDHPKINQQVLYTDKITRKQTNDGKFINQYLKVKTIGEGPFSKIKLYLDTKANRNVAIKKYNLFLLKKKTKMERGPNGQTKYSSQADQVRKQLEVLKLPDHQNVAKTYQILEDKDENKVYIVMEYCQKGDIADWNHKQSRFQLKKQFHKSFAFFKDKFIQTAKGLQYLHSINIVHRDIKPLNILLDHDLKIKIIDFGRSVILKSSQQKLKGSQGTYHFMAPQQLSQKFPEGYDGRKCDIWALGISFFGILFGKLPFYNQLMIKLFDEIENGKYEFPQKSQKYCDPFKPIIQKMLDVDPEKRYTATQLVKALEELKE